MLAMCSKTYIGVLKLAFLWDKIYIVAICQILFNSSLKEYIYENKEFLMHFLQKFLKKNRYLQYYR